ncbi:hypothetical protein [Enterococcus faecalis]|uniref:hypothetical protein n=1 Tax=Enterococcus faecalis TaxID=1351 RepID=UPI001CE2D750|nr:hypothetical protein [Enterococcus faecalis]
MDSRKKYDHWGIEISIWNKTNVVTYIDCDCGQLARKEIGKYNQFKCSSQIIYGVTGTSVQKIAVRGYMKHRNENSR